MSSQPQVLILMGSKSDHAVVSETEALLNELAIPFETHIASAHRTPQSVERLARGARERGIKVIVAAAGMSAHLAGVVAAHTLLPVVGVPLEASGLGGLDALLSMAQMPAGVPVATMSVGRAGAKNAAVFAAQIIAVDDARVRERLSAYRENMARAIDEADQSLR